ncbi:Protein THYLAKOID ASSEMBLY 8, chloroplastic [Glycine soja]
MAFSLFQNPTFLKLKPPTIATPRWGYVRVRCGGPRSQRSPLMKGRILSIEAIQAIQTLKRLHRTNPPNLSSLVSNTLTRLIKSDLLATLRELLRQQHCTIALRAFSTLRSEYGADLSLYAEIISALAAAAAAEMTDHVDRLILDLEAENEEIKCDDHKGLASLIKAVVAARSRESTVRIYGLMKKSGYGSVTEPDEYVVKVLVNGLKSFGEEALARELQDEYKIALAICRLVDCLCFVVNCLKPIVHGSIARCSKRMEVIWKVTVSQKSILPPIFRSPFPGSHLYSMCSRLMWMDLTDRVGQTSACDGLIRDFKGKLSKASIKILIKVMSFGQNCEESIRVVHQLFVSRDF